MLIYAFTSMAGFSFLDGPEMASDNANRLVIMFFNTHQYNCIV